MTRPSVTSLLSQQVPEHIRNDNGGFVTFLEAYYKYLNENEIDLVTARDLDTTLDSFIVHFRKELALNFPKNVEVDERFLLRHIKEHYLAKGSEQSYRFLFKILFDKEIELSYPSTQMLRASDGKWNQDISLFVRVEQGAPNDIIGRLVDVVTPTKIVRVLVDRRQYVEVEVERAIKVSDDIYEFIIDRRYFGNINVNDVLRYRDDSKGIFFTGVILATTSDLTIQAGGTGFKVGQLYNITNFDGYGSIMKVTKVDSNGTIQRGGAEFIKYGIGYSTDFITTIIPDSGQEEEGFAGSSVVRVLNDLTITDRMDGFSEVGNVNFYDYATDQNGDYVDGTYVGRVVREFGITTADSRISEFEPAIIDVKLGSLASYPGYFTNNDGFLNDAIYIQDSRFYQAFSYVIKIDETLSKYKTSVKNLVHPAGLALFGEYDIRNEFDISLELESLIKILSITETDEVFAQTNDIGSDGNLFTPDQDVIKDNTKLLSTHFLNDSVTADINSVIMVDTTGTLTTRTVPFIDVLKDFPGGEVDGDLNQADHSVTLTDVLTNKDISKTLSITSTNFDGNLDDERVTLTSRDLGVTGSLYGTTDVTKVLGKRLDLLSKNYDDALDQNLVRMIESPVSMGYTTSEGITNRFGLSVFDITKQLTTVQNISDTTGEDLNRTVPAFVLTTNLNDVGIDYDGNAMDNTVSFSESGIINKNPYAEAGWFLNDGGVYVSDDYTTF